MAYYSRNRIERAAEAISDLRYCEMQDLARMLCDIANDREDDFPDGLERQAMADLLSSWADATEQEIAEAMKDKD